MIVKLQNPRRAPVGGRNNKTNAPQTILLLHHGNKSSLKYYYYLRPFGDPSETDLPDRRHIGVLNMLHRRPTCLTGEPSEIDIPHKRPSCLLRTIGDQHACWEPSETDMLVDFNRNSNTFHKYNYFYLIFANLYWNNKKSPIRSLMGLRLCILVSDVFPIRHVFRSLIRHVGLRLSMSVSDQACCSLMRHAGSDGSPIII